MLFDEVIQVESLSKCYQIYDKPSDRLRQMLMRGRKKYYRDFWALRAISFSVKKGQSVGIIGKNGSGKSTLLQLICGTLNPTSGTVNTSGRIAALLELGSGFNPEFTGRENVYMNASILGLNHSEIDDKFNSIVEFADIGEFIDQPVKSYSSGMVVRLAFAVSINVNPDILIVDEALAVGDERFQRKCFSKIEAIKKRGTTILFVSHSANTIVELCDTAILIDTGKILKIGSPKDVVGVYQKLLFADKEKEQEIKEQLITTTTQTESPHDQPESDNFRTPNQPDAEDFIPELKPASTIVYEPNGAVIEFDGIYNPEGEQVNVLLKGRIYSYNYSISFTKDAENVRFGMMIKSLSGIDIGGASSNGGVTEYLNVVSGTRYDIQFRFKCLVNPGTYFLNAGVIGVIDDEERFLHRITDLSMFKVHRSSDSSSATGLVDLSCFPEISIQQ